MSSTPRHRIGVVGIGEMGLPIAERFLEAGYEVTGTDVDQDRLDRFAEAGGETAATPSAVAADADTVHVVVVDADQTGTVLFGDDGVVAGLEDGTVIVHSTISPTAVRSFADRCPNGTVLVDAAISGAAERARAGDLAVMVGGPAGPVEELRPILSPIARRVFHVGDVGAGMVAKLTNNAVFYAGAVATIEALAVGAAYDVDREVLLEVFEAGSAQNFFVGNFDHFTRDRLFDPETETYDAPARGVRMANKDLQSYRSLAEECDVETPVGAVVSQRYPPELVALIEERIAAE